MSKAKKPGRPKAYTAAKLEKAIEAYFDSISYEEPATRSETVTDDAGNVVLDRMGHPAVRILRIRRRDGTAATVTKWLEPPSITSLCLYLGIDVKTFERYGKASGDDESERICRAITRARGRVEAYLTERLEDGKASRGAIFNLQQNFGWKDRKEISLDPQTREAVTAPKTMTMAERLQILREVGDLPEVPHE